MENNIVCLRCGQTMNHIRTEKLQFGQTGWILGDLPNLLAGAMEVDIYCCPQCRKLEFFLVDNKVLILFRVSNAFSPKILHKHPKIRFQPFRTCLLGVCNSDNT